MKALQFYIELEEVSPTVSRQFAVPDNYTFYQLHKAIQGAFGWHNCHLFQFSPQDFMTDKTGYGIPDPHDEIKVKDARKALITSVFKKPGQQFLYVYDFGDCWEHRITFEEIIDDEFSRPYCIAGTGACPPEDIGGPHGYRDMVVSLSTTGHPEKKSYENWLGLSKGEKWKPEFCSVREVNARLGLLDSEM